MGSVAAAQGPEGVVASASQGRRSSCGGSKAALTQSGGGREAGEASARGDGLAGLLWAPSRLSPPERNWPARPRALGSRASRSKRQRLLLGRPAGRYNKN